MLSVGEHTPLNYKDKCTIEHSEQSEHGSYGTFQRNPMCEIVDDSQQGIILLIWYDMQFKINVSNAPC